MKKVREPVKLTDKQRALQTEARETGNILRRDQAGR